MTAYRHEDTADCVGKGWRHLVEPLIDYCHAHGIEIHQIKEKWGGLRFYHAHGPTPECATLEVMVEEAEERSLKTCEDCGQPGTRGGDGWIRTLCPACRAAFDQQRTKGRG